MFDYSFSVDHLPQSLVDYLCQHIRDKSTSHKVGCCCPQMSSVPETVTCVQVCERDHSARDKSCSWQAYMGKIREDKQKATKDL